MHRAAGVEAPGLRQLQGLHDHALAGKRRIAVNLHGEHLVAQGIAAPLLARAHRAFHHRVHHFEMRGIERERHVHIAGGGLEIGGKSLVVLDVARAAQLGEIVLALELAEQILGRFAEHVDQHIQAPAVRHGDDGFLDAHLAALLHQIVEQGNETVAALEREALLAHVLGVQVALQTFRRGQLPEDVLLLLHAEATLHALQLEMILQPQALIRVRHMRELRADRVGVDEFQVGEDIPQLRPFGNRLVAAAGEELGVEVGLGETEIFEVEHVGFGALLQPERVQVRDEVTAVRVDLDESRHGALLRARAAGFGDRRRAAAGRHR